MAFNDLEKKRIENAEDKFQGIGSMEGLITPPVFRHYQGRLLIKRPQNQPCPGNWAGWFSWNCC